MSRIITSILAYGCCMLSACDTDKDVPPPTAPPAFEKNKMTISADTAIATTSRPIIITTRCTPLVTGRGYVELYGNGSVAGSGWSVEKPVSDTLVRPGDQYRSVRFPVEFTANKPLEQQWTVRLLPEKSSGYGFSARAVMDSIFVADSGRMYSNESDVIRRIVRGGIGYYKVAYTWSGGLPLYPP